MGTKRTVPLTAGQWEALDTAWLRGDPAWSIHTNSGITYPRVVHGLRNLGYDPESRRKIRVRHAPIWDKAMKAKYDKERLASFKAAVFDHYGARCACCGEDNIGFLCVDHINNDGAEDRRRSRLASMWEAVVRRGFPDTFQILCYNCNMGKAHHGDGICPHELPVKTGTTERSWSL